MAFHHEISGRTKVFGILADPIHHVKTPQRLNEMMRGIAFDGVMIPMHVASHDLPQALAHIRHWQNFGGFIATVPHKTAMVSLCDRVNHRAQAIGAANAVRRDPDGALVADMLDGDGFVSGLAAEGVDPAGWPVYLAGAGGAANAIAFSLAAARVGHLTVYNRTSSRAAELCLRLKHHHPNFSCSVGDRDASGHRLVVNGTSLGLLSDDLLPVDVDTLDRDAVVAEVIMEPERTPLLVSAEKRGCRVHLGHHMLSHQLKAMASFLGMQK